MNLTPESQGYLGDLNSKTLPELKELLERQEKILSRKTFVEHLPDKGKKIKLFADLLRELIELRSNTKPQTTEQTHENHVASPTISDKVVAKDVPLEPCQVTSDNKDDGSCPPLEDREDDLVSRLQNVKLSEPTSSSSSFQNSYERVIKKVEDRPNKGKPKFLPNRTLRNERLELQSPKANPKDVKSYNEECAARPPDYEYKEAKLISIEESVDLIQKQRIRNEELMAEQAAKRLAAQLGTKMAVYKPPTTDLSYREPAQDSDDEAIDSDDDEDEETIDGYS